MMGTLTPLPLKQAHGLRSLVVDNLNAHLVKGLLSPDGDGYGDGLDPCLRP